jgi:hypothetical protein
MSSGYPPYGGMQSLSCQRCQAPLLPNEANCRNCGYYNAPSVQVPAASNNSWSTLTAQQPQSQSGPPSWGQFPVSSASSPATPSPQAQNTFNNPPSAPLPTRGRNFFGPPSTPSSPAQSNGYFPDQVAPSAYAATPSSFAPPRPSGALSTGPVGSQTFGNPPPGFQQFGSSSLPGQQFSGTGPFDISRTQSAHLQPFPMASGASSLSSSELPYFTKPARRSKPWMIPLIVLLILVLAGGGFAGYTVLNKHNTVTPPTTAVTGGAQKAAPLFADTFKNNTKGWSLQADPGKFSISLAASSLVLEDDNNELLWEPLPGNKIYGDFTLSVDALLSQGDQTNGYGIYIRGSSVQNAEMATYYRFELYGDGSYAIFKGTVDANGAPTTAKLVDYTVNSAIQKQGTINHVTITAKGATLTLTVNGQAVKTITDASYANGAIAPFVSNMQNAKPGAQAKFSNLTVYP